MRLPTAKDFARLRSRAYVYAPHHPSAHPHHFPATVHFVKKKKKMKPALAFFSPTQTFHYCQKIQILDIVLLPMRDQYEKKDKM